MRTLTSELIAAQHSASAVPYVHVVVRDRIGGIRRLRYEPLYDGSEPAGYHAAAMPSDGSLLRARVDGATLYYQRVASPGPSSDFSTWADLGSVADADVALCADGSRALLFYVDTDGVTLKVRESTDSGATLGSAVTVATAGSAVGWLAADVKSNGDALLLFNVGADVYTVKRSGGSWGSAAAWPHSVSSIEGIACYHQGDWNAAIAGTDSAGDAFVWTAIYGDGFLQSPDTWSALREVTRASAGSDVSFHAPSLSQPDTYRLTFVEKYAGTGSYARSQHTYSPASADFALNLWREPVPFDLESDYGQAIAFDSDALWLSTPSGVWTASLDVSDADLTADVLSLMTVDDPFAGRARVVLRNDESQYAPPPAPIGIGAELRISPGYLTSAGPEASDGPAYWITSVEHVTGSGGATLVIEARDAWSLLESWRARSQYVWESGEENVFGVLQYPFARTGLEFSSAGASAAASDQYPSFTVHPSESALTAVKRLLAKLPDVIFVRGEFAFLKEPLTTASVDYAYGGGHPLLAGRYTDRAEAANRVQVFGEAVFGERFDWPAVEETYDRLAQVLDRNVASVAVAEDRADAVLRKAEMAATNGEITVPVNCGQELYDVIEVTDALAGLSAAKRRVLGLRTEFDTAKGVYQQRIALGAV